MGVAHLSHFMHVHIQQTAHMDIVTTGEWMHIISSMLHSRLLKGFALQVRIYQRKLHLADRIVELP